MITSPVTKEQLEKWKYLWRRYSGLLSPNRISGAELDGYFRGKYEHEVCDRADIRSAAEESAKQYSGKAPDVACYVTDGDVNVCIDRTSGYFHVESSDTEKMAKIYDDLFAKRGLSDEDMRNYVIVGQYLELKGFEVRNGQYTE